MVNLFMHDTHIIQAVQISSLEWPNPIAGLDIVTYYTPKFCLKHHTNILALTDSYHFIISVLFHRYKNVCPALIKSQFSPSNLAKILSKD